MLLFVTAPVGHHEESHLHRKDTSVINAVEDVHMCS